MTQASLSDAIDIAENFLVRHVNPASLAGALFYLLVFLLLGLVLDLSMRRALRAALARDTRRRLDPTATGFLQALASVGIWIVVAVAYAHLIPALRNLGTALPSSTPNVSFEPFPRLGVNGINRLEA